MKPVLALSLYVGVFAWACSPKETRNVSETPEDVSLASPVDNKNSENIVSQPEQEPLTEPPIINPYAPFQNLDLAATMHKRFREHMTEVTGITGSYIIDSEIIPLGWSSNGRNFAYALEPADEACGCYLISIKIQDLVTDKILWEKDEDEPSNADWSIYWNENKTVIETAFAKYGIQENSIGNFSPGLSAGDVTFSISKTMEVMPDYSYDPGIGNYSIVATSTSMGTKTLHQDKLDYPFLYDLEVMGHIKGPDENRVAIVIGQVWRGWEGPPNTTRFEIIGAHLKTGFK